VLGLLVRRAEAKAEQLARRYSGAGAAAAAAGEAVSDCFGAWNGSPCLRPCAHGASIGGCGRRGPTAGGARGEPGGFILGSVHVD
jgi:hypothetical protein